VRSLRNPCQGLGIVQGYGYQPYQFTRLGVKIEKLNTGIQKFPKKLFVVSFVCRSAIAMSSNTPWNLIQELAETLQTVGNNVEPMAYRFIEQWTESLGQAVTPIANNPLVQTATRIPGLNWLVAALGQVDLNQVQQDLVNLQQKHPTDLAPQLAQRIVSDTTLKAGAIGLATNLLPPVALMLFAVDIAALSSLQAGMLYRIAAAYGFDLHDPARRGEVLAIYILSLGGTGVLKAGLSLPEALPGIGAAIGATGDAALIYTLGQAACRFYENKHKASAL
jgi:uncharacterized protein (DUF697 family)